MSGDRAAAMTIRSAALPARAASDRLAAVSDAYRVASECYQAACKYGVTGDAEAAIWAIVQREADAANRASGVRP